MATAASDSRYLYSSSPSSAKESSSQIGGRKSSDAMAAGTRDYSQESRQLQPTRTFSGKINGHKAPRAQKLDKPNSPIRKNSLRRAKDSTDALRQRSRQMQNSASHAAVDGSSGGREGRQFTVGNVGNNGIIYLRPVKRSALLTNQDSPFILPPATPPSSTSSENTGRHLPETQARDSVWTRHSAIVHTKGERSAPKVSKENETRNGRVRSSSESTIDANSARQSLEQGAFKVVIERAGSSHKEPQDVKLSLPTLEVPIPHYRLGTPRFSDRGTAFLHNSIYTRTSTNEDLKTPAIPTSELERLFPMPPGFEQQSLLTRRHSHSSPKPYPLHLKPASSQDGPPVANNSHVSHPSHPIVPSIYDALAATPNNPAVVRFSPLTGDITAATPARIIAQVTSENFLDYELLSDFFLTVRAYLSTHDLLAYLVARFEWAINRFDDNGRVIRVRAFAALRHWILNYFPYDFLYDRPLRVDFCQRLNELTRLIRGRIHYGNSDMKLISDLKKCWNGRCILYWDYPEDASTNPQETDIHPGGIPGSRDSRLHHASQLVSLGASAEQVAPLHLAASRESDRAAREADNTSQEPGSRFANGHVRQESATTIRSLPISPISEQSIQALSCSIPAKSLKRMLPHTNKPTDPTSTQQTSENRRVCPAAPSSTANDNVTQPISGHKRSGSFSDAARDRRASLSSERHVPSQDQDQLPIPYLGSLIRGNLVQPPQPYVNIHAPTTPSIEVPNVTFSAQDNGISSADDRRPSEVPGPGVKNLIGNIRRALSRKYSTSNGSVNFGAGFASVPSLPNEKNPTPPAKLVFTEVYRKDGKGSKSTLRIDLLAADIAEAFHRAMMEHVEQGHDPQDGFQLALELEHNQSVIENRQPSSEHHQSTYEHETPDYLRVKSNIGSGITSGSQSIVIVNDTGFINPPVPSLPEFLQHKVNLHSQGFESFTMTRSATPPLSTDPSMQSFPPDQIERQKMSVDSSMQVTPPRLAVPLATGGQPSFSLVSGSASATTIVLDNRSEWTRSRVIRGQSFRTNRTGSSSLRKYASYQSTFTKTGAAGSTFDTSIPAASITDTNNHSVDGTANHSSPSKPTNRTLRRKPGGDLKANHHVHDMEGLHRARSMGSITTYSGSQRGSFLDAGRRVSHRSGSHRSSRGARSTSIGRQRVGSQRIPSFVHTHSSQPAIRRPSFEAAVAEFARIPDDDEGGIEATLLKLEGKYTKSPVESSMPQRPFSLDNHEVENTEGNPDKTQTRQPQQRASACEPHSSPNVDPADNDPEPRRRDPRQSFLDDQSPSEEYSIESRGLAQSFVSSRIYAGSEGSYNSIPLLDRSSSARIPRRNLGQNANFEAVPHPSFNITQLPHLEHLREDGNFRRRGRGSSIPTTTTDSFLLDDDESLSDLSSDMSGDLQDHVHRRGNATTPRTSNYAQEIPALNIDTHPPSPPMSTENATSPTGQAKSTLQPRRPPTPDPSPISQHALPTVQSTLQSNLASQTSLQNSLHLPFVVGYESELLAQQFTIIEKDALNEIDWRDLVDMRWHESSPKITNWVDYLRSTHDSRGIDLVTARFNIMAKWALSEIMLTRNVEERALTIMKYIHIAHQARQIRNYATLLQITIALTSIDCTRLARTWEKVPAGERKILAELESLVTPRKNFQNLRLEMEKANAEQGCIPVVALYIHDLTINASKPAYLSSATGGEPLVNFERHRTTAIIVKSLLQLIDASSRYTFKPIEGMIEKCLWMAALPDEVIRQRSKELE